MNREYKYKPGHRYPPGANPEADGVNFSIFSRHATSVELLLFESDDSPEPFQVIHLDQEINRTFFAWHVFVEDLPVGTWYNWRMDGPNNTGKSGLRFDKEKHLLDPWARAVSQKIWDREAACQPGNNGYAAMRGLVVDDDYDWEGDQPLVVKFETCIIYELHVGGFTRHSSSKVKTPGTFSGLIEKIPYLQELGITHVELLPVMAFDEQDMPPKTASLGLKNYWGYSTHSFFSPHPGYCIAPETGSHQREFRDLVKTLHRAGIGIILDVVFNHTSEGGQGGPVINFKGMGNEIFYHLDSMDRSMYRDYTGCGNTVNANHPVVANYIISCLEYWVREMHVDGFRFDLASALARGENGAPMHDSPVLWGIELSDQLAETKLIAEAWDAAGLYQVGSFPGYRWAEWNGKYRDIVRQFVRGDKNVLGELATRLGGSSDLYEYQGRLPINSINFVTCHDGFTLNDLVSYNEKHNLANGEDNRDGCSNNISYNCGVEGPTEDVEINALRRRQAKNIITILLVSQGLPMILSGDEVLNTQDGNNNGYCQDNELTWFDWTLVEDNRDMLRFFQCMIQLRKRNHVLMRRRFLKGNTVDGRNVPDITWHGKELEKPGWNDPEARVLAYTLASANQEGNDLHIMFNMSDEAAEMELPDIPGRKWLRAVDTSLQSPHDILQPGDQKLVRKKSYKMAGKSVCILEGHLKSHF